MIGAGVLLLTHASGESEGEQLLQHVLMDYAFKAVIVIAALILLATGMIILWKKVGKSPEERRGQDASR